MENAVPVTRIEPPRLRDLTPAGLGEISPDPRARVLRITRVESNLYAPVIASLLTHALVIALLVLHWNRKQPEEQVPPAQVALVWQPNPSRKLSLPESGKVKNAPPAEERPQGNNQASSPPPSLPSEASTEPQQTEAPEASKAEEQKATNEKQTEAAKKSTYSPNKEAKRTTPRPSPNSNPFANMTNLSLGNPGQPQPQTEPAGPQFATVAGAAPKGASSNGPLLDSIDAPNANPNWLAKLRAYIESHDFYPQAAIAKHEEGISSVSVTIDKYGKVLDVQVIGRSGSDRLDDAWLSVFDHRNLPQPTPDMNVTDTYTFNATLQYVLIEMQAPQ